MQFYNVLLNCYKITKTLIINKMFKEENLIIFYKISF